MVITELEAPSGGFQCCCFSRDGRSVAGSNKYIIYVWNITSSYPYLVEAFVEHTRTITSLTFSHSSLISLSYDGSVKFWLIGALSTDLVATGLGSTLLGPTLIEFVTLQTSDGNTVPQGIPQCLTAGRVNDE